MRLYHFTLIFAVFALAAAIICENKLALSAFKPDNRRILDTAFDRACDAAAITLRTGGEELSAGSIEEAETRFVNTLCAYFGINAFSPEGRMLMQKIPVLAVTCTDGMYVGYLEDQNGTVVRRWTSKILYGNRAPEEILEEYCVDMDLNGFVSPMSLSFELPEDDAGMFQRNAHDTGFAVFYRSPVSVSGQIPQYTFASSVARLSDRFYVNISGSGYGSPMYYHLKDCVYRNDECLEFSSRKECAEYGAYCCPVCKDVIF